MLSAIYNGTMRCVVYTYTTYVNVVDRSMGVANGINRTEEGHEHDVRVICLPGGDD